MANQTTYDDRMAVGFPGMLSDTGYYDNDSMTVVTADVPYGSPVAYGAADRTCRPMAAGDTRIAGVAIRVQGGNAETNSDDEFKVGDTASVMKKGRIYVTVSAAVDAGDIVHVNLTNGAWLKTGHLLVANAVYETGAAIGGLAVVRIT